MSFLLYNHFFYMLEYLTGICLLHVDVGLVRPIDYAWNRRCPRPEATAAATEGVVVVGNLLVGEAERVLR
jgi:hypothetical protein